MIKERSSDILSASVNYRIRWLNSARAAINNRPIQSKNTGVKITKKIPEDFTPLIKRHEFKFIYERLNARDTPSGMQLIIGQKVYFIIIKF